MKTLEIEISCPECKSAIVDDLQNGERICSSCGIVVDEQMAAYGPETKTVALISVVRKSIVLYQIRCKILESGSKGSE